MLLAGGLACFTACQLANKKGQTTDAAKHLSPTEAPALTKKMNYPETKKTEHLDQYHGNPVADPYRWLENDTTRAVATWVKAQNQVTFNYLDQIPYRAAIRERLTRIWNYPKYGVPFKRGSRYYFYKNDGLQNQSILYVQQDLQAQPAVFIDPNVLSADGTTSLTTLSFSKDNKYVVYGTSGGGSDWNTFQVMHTQTREMMPDKLEWIKFSGAAWFKNGFFYSRYDAPVNGSKLAAKNEYHKVYYHVGRRHQHQRPVCERPPEGQKPFPACGEQFRSRIQRHRQYWRQAPGADHFPGSPQPDRAHRPAAAPAGKMENARTPGRRRDHHFGPGRQPPDCKLHEACCQPGLGIRSYRQATPPDYPA
jgi:hypothetical protein